jgi:hypothetical protein
MAEKFNMADLLHIKNLHCSIVKNLLPILKNQNGVYLRRRRNQDSVENVYIFHPIFSKMIFLSIFLYFG